MKKNILPSLVLGCICLVVALLLSVVNMFTAPVIAERQNAAANAALLEVLPNGSNFKEIELTSDYPAVVKKGHSADGGFVFQMELIGKSSGLIIMVGVDSEGKVTGTKVIANQETPSYAEKVFPALEGTNGAYTGMTLDSFVPQLTSGATLSSKAYSEAVKAALQSFAIANGVEVDTRSDEEKHNDALNFALGTTGKTFEKWFGIEEIAGVSAIYTCDSGVVIILGDNYVGFDTEGNAVKTATMNSQSASDLSDALKAEAETAYESYQAALDSSIEITEDYPAIVKSATKLSSGYVFTMVLSGKEDGLTIQVTVDLDGKIADTKVIDTHETPNYAANVFPNVEGTNGVYTGTTLESFEEYIVAGSTLTSRAYAEAVKAALQSYVLAQGGSVDTRTEEQKHSDACNLALGTTDKTFERWFMTETIEGVYNIYTCDEGVVIVINGVYVGINANGQAVNSATKESTEASEVNAELKAEAEAAYAIYAVTLDADYRTEVAKPANTSKRVTKIELTKTGNYIMYMEGAGNGKAGEEYAHPTDRYIEFMVCISADGVIIDVMTTSRGTESVGFGDVCETDAYTEQFRGATVDNIVITEEGTSSSSTDLGIISGATVTSNGYQEALQRAFKAFQKLTDNEGGNQ